MTLNGSLYRIITEDINRSKVINLASKHFQGFTLRPGGIGYWEGKPEKSITLEVITDKPATINKLAGEIKQLNNQEAVLVEVIKNHAWLV